MRCYPSQRLALCLALILSVLMNMIYGELGLVKIVRITGTHLIEVECDKPKMSIVKVPDLDISFCKCLQCFFLHLDTVDDPESARCKPCWNCKHEQVRPYEIQPCRSYTDALCCPDPSMVAKTTVHGYEDCEKPQVGLPSTRDSSSGSPNTHIRYKIEQPIPTTSEARGGRTDKIPSEIATETKSGPSTHETDEQSETGNSNESRTEGQGQSESETGTESNNKEETWDFNRGGAVVDIEDCVGCLGVTFRKKSGVVERYTCKKDRQMEKDANNQADKSNDILNRLGEIEDLIYGVNAFTIITFVLVVIVFVEMVVRRLWEIKGFRDLFQNVVDAIVERGTYIPVQESTNKVDI